MDNPDERIAGAAPGALEQILACHERTKHRLERYAAGPETLNWSSQPDPFRYFEGASRVRLPLAADRLTTLRPSVTTG